MIKIYSFIGVNGSGKDFCKEKIIKENKKQKIYNFDFSDGVREYTFGFLGVYPKSKEEYEKFKEKYSIIRMGNYSIKRKGRQFLDNIGLMMRNFDSNFWVNYVIKQAKEIDDLDSNCIILFGSCRYINEAEGIFLLKEYFENNLNKKVEIKFIFCDYRSKKYDDKNYDYQKLALEIRKNKFKHESNVTSFFE